MEHQTLANLPPPLAPLLQASTSSLPDLRHLTYRTLRPTDAAALRHLHDVIFPINYDSGFFEFATHGKGIVGWAAVLPQDCPAGLPDETTVFTEGEQLVGFITARDFVGRQQIPVADWQLLGLDDSASPAHHYNHSPRVTYLLTLGVAKKFRKAGIASALLQLIEQHSIQEGCRALYLHVISYNVAAMNFYKRAGFDETITLRNFYHIPTGRALYPDVKDYDASLFVKHIRNRAVVVERLLTDNENPTDDNTASGVEMSPLSAFWGSIWQSIWTCLPPRIRPTPSQNNYKRNDGDFINNKNKREATNQTWLRSLFVAGGGGNVR